MWLLQDGDGLVTGPELQATLGLLMGGYTPSQLERVVLHTLQEYDRDGDGGLNFEEFVALLSAEDLQAKLSMTAL
jgi:Ca2+-binding EF-hand superfamily protein